MRLSRIFLYTCAFWLFIEQALAVLGLWRAEADCPTLFGSVSLENQWWRAVSLAFDSLIVLLILGFVLTLAFLARERRLGPNSVTVMSGVIFLIAGFAGTFPIWQPELYLPPPRLPQLMSCLWTVAVDVLAVLAVFSLLRFGSESEADI